MGPDTVVGYKSYTYDSVLLPIRCFMICFVETLRDNIRHGGEEVGVVLQFIIK